MNNPKIKQINVATKTGKSLHPKEIVWSWQRVMECFKSICEKKVLRLEIWRTFCWDMSIEIGKYEKIGYGIVLNSWHVAKDWLAFKAEWSQNGLKWSLSHNAVRHTLNCASSIPERGGPMVSLLMDSHDFSILFCPALQIFQIPIVN